MYLQWSIILQCGLSVGKLNLVSILVYVVYARFQGNLMCTCVNSVHMYIRFLTHKSGDEVSLFFYIHIGRLIFLLSKPALHTTLTDVPTYSTNLKHLRHLAHLSANTILVFVTFSMVNFVLPPVPAILPMALER